MHGAAFVGEGPDGGLLRARRSAATQPPHALNDNVPDPAARRPAGFDRPASLRGGSIPSA